MQCWGSEQSIVQIKERVVGAGTAGERLGHAASVGRSEFEEHHRGCRQSAVFTLCSLKSLQVENSNFVTFKAVLHNTTTGTYKPFSKLVLNLLHARIISHFNSFYILNSLAYVSHEDIYKVFDDDTLLAIQAPSGTQLEVPIPDNVSIFRFFLVLYWYYLL